MNRTEKRKLLKQLSAVFGKKKSKSIIEEILQIKQDNPDKAFSFVFKEDGTFLAIDKEEESKREKEEEELWQ